MAEMIRLGAYQMGADAATDEAIYFHDRLEIFLAQQQNEQCDLTETYQMLAEILADGQA